MNAQEFKFYDIEQNTEEWLDLRVGLYTSSNAGKVMANYGKAFGDPAKKYAVQIAIEQITGKKQSSDYNNDHMERGHEEEPLARMAYCEEMFCDVSNGGFFGSNFIGCSPDGLVNDCGVIEIKSVIPSVHFANVKRGTVDPAYKWQCIGNLKYTEREWLDFVSFCNTYPDDKKLFVYRIFAKNLQEEFAMLDARTTEFKKLVDETRDNIINANYMILH